MLNDPENACCFDTLRSKPNVKRSPTPTLPVLEAGEEVEADEVGEAVGKGSS